MQSWVLLLLLGSFACTLSQETKFWKPQVAVDEWYFHPIKCPKTTLRFEEDALEFLEGNTHEKEIIFAQTGYYIFQSNAHMIIGDNAEITPQECSDSFGEEVVVHSVKSQPWTSPYNWFSATNGNPAKPDIERIPCDSDEVVFDTLATRVDLSGLYQLQMKRVSITEKWLQPREFGSFCKTAAGQKMFEGCEEVDFIQSVGDPLTRACHSNTKLTQSLVCEHVKCSPAKCMDPIRPIGFCCDICGASAQVVVHHNVPINITDLNKAIGGKLVNWAGQDISYYSSLFNFNTKFILQTTIVETAGYSGESVKAMKKVQKELLQKAFVDVDVQSSGVPYDPTGKVNTFLLIFMPLFVILGIFFGAYKMSYDEDFQTNWRSLMHRFTGRSQFIFAQFENVLEDHDGRITISHTQPSAGNPIAVETGIECKDNENSGGMEMVAGGPEEKSTLPKDKLDEIVETISATESVSLISVDM